MGLNASVLQKHLARAERHLEACVKGLKEKGVEESQWSQCPDWRHADADRRQAKRRLIAAETLRQAPAASGEEPSDEE